MLKPFVASAVVVLLLTILSCTKERAKVPEPPDPTEPVNECPVTYRDNIRPIVTSKCALTGCHVTGFPFGDFAVYADLKKRIENGRLQLLVFQEGLMPPQGSLQLDEKEKTDLKCWIEHGAPNN